MFIGSIFWLMFKVAELIIGVGLILNCIRGLVKQEWVYDQQSSQMMNLSQMFGIIVGLALIAHAVGLFRIPLPFFPL